MKITATAFAIGLVLAGFGLLYMPIGGPCQTGNCGIPLNVAIFSTGLGIMAVALLYEVWRRTRHA
jgi:hypothetical protein